MKPWTSVIPEEQQPHFSDDGGHPCTAVVPICIFSGQVGSSHENKALIWTTILQEDVNAFLTCGLSGIGQCTVSMGITGHNINTVLWKEQVDLILSSETVHKLLWDFIFVQFIVTQP